MCHREDGCSRLGARVQIMNTVSCVVSSEHRTHLRFGSPAVTVSWVCHQNVDGIETLSLWKPEITAYTCLTCSCLLKWGKHQSFLSLRLQSANLCRPKVAENLVHWHLLPLVLNSIIAFCIMWEDDIFLFLCGTWLLLVTSTSTFLSGHVFNAERVGLFMSPACPA